MQVHLWAVLGVGVEQAEQSSRPEQRRHSSSFTRPGIRGEEKKFALDLGRRGRSRGGGGAGEDEEAIVNILKEARYFDTWNFWD